MFHSFATGSYLKDINYTSASTQQINSLIKASAHCEQFIKYECRSSVLLWHGLAYGWWVSRDGQKMDYWGGSVPGSWKCACGITGTCQGGYACNCDANDGVWREDSGLLKDKSTLPVSQLRFGDTGNPNEEKGFHTLGKLKCYGIAWKNIRSLKCQHYIHYWWFSTIPMRVSRTKGPPVTVVVFCCRVHQQWLLCLLSNVSPGNGWKPRIELALLALPSFK